ncbi:E3 ubiquitin-protein ligase CCNB1IP1-like [Plodia interpunctella]|uniref:E3 ubiquitin-protein ligase CCNB1IP1-like n=1 Tax=Plodia interpunctella TaxID=58824 RepID=UPI00236828DF|nr:E3 ubiquitin-protein ligase CCNB1IP1-like [Plodia interpunctella]
MHLSSLQTITMDMMCNFRKCRRSLSNQAWVTTCSHAFCIEHGQREFKRNAENCLTCPACGSELRDKFDVIQADLKPSETFKSIVLAGLKPDTIMDVAMRAMSFWSYQIEQETMYQESMAKHSREKLVCLEEINNLNLQKIKAELETCKRKIVSLQEEYNVKRRQNEELKARLEDRSRKIQKLTFQLEAQKRKDIRGNNVEENSNINDPNKCMDISALMRKRSASEAFVFRPAKEMDESHVNRLCSPKTPIFDFRPKSSKRQSNFKFRPLSS